MGFVNPPVKARSFVRWWWNGDCGPEDEILRELDLMQAAGLGGVEIKPITVPEDAPKPATPPPKHRQKAMNPNPPA